MKKNKNKKTNAQVDLQEIDLDDPQNQTSRILAQINTALKKWQKNPKVGRFPRYGSFETTVQKFIVACQLAVERGASVGRETKPYAKKTINTLGKYISQWSTVLNADSHRKHPRIGALLALVKKIYYSDDDLPILEKRPQTGRKPLGIQQIADDPHYSDDDLPQLIHISGERR